MSTLYDKSNIWLLTTGRTGFVSSRPSKQCQGLCKREEIPPKKKKLKKKIKKKHSKNGVKIHLK